MEYISTSEAAKKWKITRRRVSKLCAEGRIDGAVCMGNMWLVPQDAEKPDDERSTKIKN